MVVHRIHDVVIHILVSDYKPLSLDNARLETEAYAVSALQNSIQAGSFVILGMPITTSCVELWVLWL